jgi:hypothetical protein
MNHTTHRLRSAARPRSVVALFVVPLALAAAGCGGDDGDARFESAARKAQTSTTQTTSDGAGSPTSVRATGEPSATSTTPAATPATPAESLLAAVDAYEQALGGGTVQVLQLTTHFPVDDTAYASLQSQDPAAPANVDERAWRNGKVGEPNPVKLSGDGTLEENLFPLESVNWAAVAAALDGAPALVEQQLGATIENGDGVTHIIAEKDLPFSANTVVRVYVDGGARTTGGYVQYLADGTLDKVQA